jgi:hypothetical protein
MDSPELVYGPARVRRIRIALGAAVALGMLSGVFAVLVATRSDEDGAGVYAAVLGVVSAGTVAWSLITWRLLDTPDRTAKRAAVLTGALLLLFALPTVGFFMGLLFALLGLTTLFLALISDGDSGT